MMQHKVISNNWRGSAIRSRRAGQVCGWRYWWDKMGLWGLDAAPLFCFMLAVWAAFRSSNRLVLLSTKTANPFSTSRHCEHDMAGKRAGKCGSRGGGRWMSGQVAMRRGKDTGCTGPGGDQTTEGHKRPPPPPPLANPAPRGRGGAARLCVATVRYEDGGVRCGVEWTVPVWQEEGGWRNVKATLGQSTARGPVASHSTPKLKRHWCDARTKRPTDRCLVDWCGEFGEQCAHRVLASAGRAKRSPIHPSSQTRRLLHAVTERGSGGGWQGA